MKNLNSIHKTAILITLFIGLAACGNKHTDNISMQNLTNDDAEPAKNIAGKGVYNSTTKTMEWKDAYCATSVNGKYTEIRYPFGVYNATSGKIEWKESYFVPVPLIGGSAPTHVLHLGNS